MKSSASDVSSYIADAPADRKAALERLHQLCREHLSGYEEEMDYGMPAHKKGGILEVAFASQKQYIALYIMKKDVLDGHRGALAGCSTGKGCIRFRSAVQIDFNVVESLLAATFHSNAPAC